MRLYIIELKILLKNQLKIIVIWNLLILGIGVLIRLTGKGEAVLGNLQVLLNQIPQSTATGLKFIHREDMSTSIKVLFLFLTGMNFPILYCGFKITAQSLEKEESMGTITFTLNRMITKKHIIIAKYIAGIISYAILLLSMYVSAMIVYFISGTEKISYHTTAKWFGHIFFAMFVTGLLFMALGVFYASVKSKRARVDDFIASGMLLTTFIGSIPSILQFLTMILERAQVDSQILGKLLTESTWVKYIGIPFWCLPQYVYENGMPLRYAVISIIGILACSIAGIWFYDHREQGEEN